MDRRWDVRREAGDVGVFHAASVLDGAVSRTATFVGVTRTTLVRGSSQPADRVDTAEAERRGVDVVGRRSGGGAVLLVPGEFVWLDLCIGVDDPLWCDDVARAMIWVGELWVAALASLGLGGEVHRGALQPSPWSTDVCWTGRGTGEVVDPDGRKVVGISQRRSRHGARFQSMAHLTWRPDLVAALVASPGPSADEIEPAAAVVAATGEALEAALVAHLP